MVAGAELGHLEGADLDPVEIFAVLGETAIGDIEGELPAGFLRDQLGQFFDMFGKGPPLTPERDIPFRRKGFAGEGHAQGGNEAGLQGPVHFLLPDPFFPRL